jgi:hypothetical protein
MRYGRNKVPITGEEIVKREQARPEERRIYIRQELDKGNGNAIVGWALVVSHQLHPKGPFSSRPSPAGCTV